MQDPDFVIPLLDPKFTDPIKTKYLDVPYADGPNQKMDIYLPDEGTGTAPYPTVVYFHGGAFMIGTRKDDALEPMLRGVHRGYVVVSVEYRRSGEARFPAMVYDGKAAIRFLRANAQKYSIDPDRIALWGPSSGGWLVSFIAATAGNPAFEDLSMGNADQSSAVQAVVDWCGPCGDFTKMDDAFNVTHCGIPDHNDPMSPESQFLGCQITRVKELSRLACPITYLSDAMPPVCIFHGEIDQVVPVQQSLSFADAIRKVCGPDRVELHVEAGKLHHGHPWYHEQYVSDACYAFLDKLLK